MRSGMFVICCTFFNTSTCGAEITADPAEYKQYTRPSDRVPRSRWPHLDGKGTTRPEPPPSHLPGKQATHRTRLLTRPMFPNK